MAKNYNAKLTLEDNWDAVMNKAIKTTQKLSQEFKKIEKAKASPQITPTINKTAMRAFDADMARLRNTRINIGARMDASVHSTLNSINSRIQPNRTIRIQARDEVTRTVSNVQRNLFTMQRQMDVGMRNPFRNFSVSATGASRSVSSLMNGMTMMNNLSRLAGASSAAAMLGGGLGGAALLSRTRKVYTPAIVPGPPSVRGAVQGAKNDVATRMINNRLRVTNGSEGFAEEGGMAWDKGSNLDRMVRKQKYVMQKRGVPNYLNKYQSRSASVITGGTPNDSTTETFRALTLNPSRFTKVWNGISAGGTKAADTVSKAFKKAEGVINSIKASGAVTAATRVQFAFQRAAYHTTAAFYTAGAKLKDTFKPLDRAVDASVRGIGKIGRVIGKVVTAPAKIAIKAIDMVTAPARYIAAKLKPLTNKIHEIKVKLDNSKAIQGLKSIGSKIGSVIGGAIKAGAIAGIAAIGAGAVAAAKGAMDLEKQKVAMEHFINFADKQKNGGKGTKTGAAIKGETNGYVDNLRGLANSTPFSTNEIVTAGARAVNVMGGDTKGAMDLTKISADMAALNPGKSPIDAMEALADAKLGEFERLKEFGLKISQADFKASVGKGENDQLTPEETNKAYQKLMNDKLKPMFGGGANDLAGTAGGMMSTITGKMGSSLTDIGTAFLPQMKTGMTAVLGFMDSVTPKVIAFFEVLSGKKAATGNMVNVMNTMRQVGAVVKDVFSGAKNIVAQAIPVIQGLIKNLTPTFIFLGGLVGKIMTAIGDKMWIVTDIIGKLGQIWSDIFPTIQSVLESAWGIIEPIFNTLMDTARIIADIFMLLWPGIKDSIEALWEGIKPVFDLMGKALEGISKFAGWVADKLDGVLGKKKETDEASADADAKTDGSRNGRAVGMAYIPYNGYQASLHRGESILTRQEADAWREGRSGSGKGAASISINVNGSDNPDVVAQKVYNKLVEASANMA
jgi:hypothetical protein